MSKRSSFLKKIEDIFFETLLLETKRTTVGIIYRYPKQSNFFETLNENFAKLDTLKKELYIFRVFNINLYQNQHYAGRKKNTPVSTTVSNDAKNYLKFCTMFGLTQIIKSPTHRTRIINRIKTGGAHKKIKSCLLKNYTVDAYKNALRKMNFPNYEYFEYVNQAY